MPVNTPIDAEQIISSYLETINEVLKTETDEQNKNIWNILKQLLQSSALNELERLNVGDLAEFSQNCLLALSDTPHPPLSAYDLNQNQAKLNALMTELDSRTISEEKMLAYKIASAVIAVALASIFMAVGVISLILLMGIPPVVGFFLILPIAFIPAASAAAVLKGVSSYFQKFEKGNDTKHETLKNFQTLNNFFQTYQPPANHPSADDLEEPQDLYSQLGNHY